MARLPSEADINAIPSAESGRPIASIDTSAIGKGVQALGLGVEKLGAGLAAYQHSQEQYDYANAHADLMKKSVELDTKYLNDTDYATRADRYNAELNSFVQERAAQIQSPRIRERFLAGAGQVNAQRLYQQTAIAQRQGNQDALVKLDGEGQYLLDSTIGSNDEATRTAALDGYSSRVDALVEGRVMTPVQGMALKRKYAKAYNLARTNYLIDNAAPGDGSLDKLAGDIRSTTPAYDTATANIDTLQGPARERAAFRFFISKGWTPAQAAGIVGGLKGETANLNTTEVHDGGIGYGIAGWNGDRLAELQRFAKEHESDPSSLKTQLEFVNFELHNAEQNSGARIAAASTPTQAGQATLGYFRPKDYNVPGAHPERARNAGVVFAQYGGEKDIPTLGDEGGGAPRSPFSFLSTPERQQLLQKIERAKTAQLIDIQREDALMARQQSHATADQEIKLMQQLADPATAGQVTAKSIANDPVFSQSGEYGRAAIERMTRVVAQGDRNTDKYGDGFFDLWKRVFAPDGDPAKITDPTALAAHVSPDGKGLTVAGYNELYKQMNNKRSSPEAAADSALLTQFFKNAHTELVKADPFGVTKDPKGEQLHLQFMTQALPQFYKKRAEGIPASQLLDPKSPEYIGKNLESLKRTPEQIYRDLAADTPADNANDPLLRAMATGSATKEQVVAGIQAGKIPRDQGYKYGLERKWWRETPQVSVPVSR